MLSILLLGMQGKSPEDIERQRLIEQQTKLSERIASLNHEQEFLLMQKAFYASDSKYILLDLPTRTGMLKFRNRVLRTFAFSTTAGKRPFSRNTILKMTAKTDGNERKRTLLFGDALLIQPKRSSSVAGSDVRVPRILVGSKDFAALYYAVEQGTMLYVGK
ncbi:MAG: hypothetical protein AABZ15_16095 [Nitrospirota bacterium]